MGRPKGSNNQRPRISYPRICDCGYSANNPAMWSYHKKTHEPIPEGQLCDFGCGNLAKARNTGGRYTCDPEGNGNRCPTSIATIKERVSKDWADAPKRRSEAGLHMKRMTKIERQAFGEKVSASWKAKFRSLENTSSFRKYKRRVHSQSQRVLNQNKSINPMNKPIGRFEYHLDHKVSKHTGYLLGIPAEYLYNPHNLEVIFWKDNISKSSYCSIHPITLLELCEAPSQIVESVRLKLLQLEGSFVL